MSLKLSIVTPLKKLVTDLEVKSVTLPAFKGELTILDHHEPLVSTLETGVLTYIDDATAKPVQMVISWGYVEINNGDISVLAETVETLKDLDFERAKNSLNQAEQALKTTDDLATIEKYQNKVKKAESRLKLS
jgi:F-type H+-transporting ATPase subunit epsilon